MAFNMKTWANPINLDATNLNRIEQGVQNNADILDIIQDEVANLQNKQADITSDLKTLLNDAPNITETLTNITSILEKNDISSILSSTDSFLTKAAQTLTTEEIKQVYKNLGIDKFLKLTSITVDGKDVVSGSKVNITLPTIDTALSTNSDRAISNAAVTRAINQLKKSIQDIDIYIPTDLSEFNQDDDHMLVTKTDKSLWNSYKTMFTTPDNITKLLSDYALVDHDHDAIYSQIYHTHAEIIQAIPVDYVDKSTDQEIGGNKKFTNAVNFNEVNGECINYNSFFYINGTNLGTLVGSDGSGTYFGVGARKLNLRGNTTRPYYGSVELALYKDIPTKLSAFTNDSGYLKSYTETDPTVPAWAKMSTKPTYTYDEILNTPTIPTNNNQLTNGAGYITSSQASSITDTKLTTFETNKITPINNEISLLKTKDTQLSTALSNLETSSKTYTDTAIAKLVGSAPSTLDTLKELADAITQNDSILDALTETVANHTHDATYSKLDHTHSIYAKLAGDTFTGIVKFNEVDGKCINFTNQFYINGNNGSSTLLGADADKSYLGMPAKTMYLRGNITRPYYNSKELALYSDVTTAQSTLQSNIDTAQSTLQSNIATLDSKVVHIEGSEDILGKKIFMNVIYVPDITIS